MAPLVSILLPTYNGSATIEAAIASLLRQTLRNLEILVIDDGSTDGTAECVRAIDDPRIRLLGNDRNLGISASLNRGIAEAAGRYLARHDDDDLAEPQRLERQTAFLEASPDLIACGSWAEVFGRAQGLRRPATDSADLCCELLFRNRIVHPSITIDRHRIAGNLVYDPEFDGAEDYDLWVRLLEHGRLATLPEVLVRIRQHAANVTATATARVIAAANRVRRRQFEALGLTIDDDTLLLFQRFARGEWPLARHDLIAVGLLLERVLEANRRSNRYDQVALERRVGTEWWQACRAHSRYGLYGWNVYRRSPLAALTPKPQRHRATFAARSVLRR